MPVLRPREHALPVLAGVLLALSFPPARLLVPAFVGLVPLLLFIADRSPGPAGRWEATRGGIITGVVYFGLQLYWIAVALLRYSILAIPAYAGVVLVLAGLTGAFAWAVHYARERLALPLPLLAAVFWTTLEWTQAHLGDLAFPWLGLGTALAPFPTLAGAADLVGARGLTFWIAGVNGLIASTVLLHRAGRPLAPRLVITLVIIAAPAAYGVLRATQIRMTPAARVAVVQPNIPEDVKLGPAGLDSSLAALTRLTLSLEGQPLDLVAWPEVALPADFVESGRLEGAVRRMSQRVNAPILVGAYGLDESDGAGRDGGGLDGGGRSAGERSGGGRDGGGRDGSGRHNSAFLVDAGDGLGAPARYDKQRLVPFIERVPFIDPRLLAGGSGSGRFGALDPGSDRPVVRTRAGAFGILICYESIFAPAARAYRDAGADYLVNITNDAWYGRDEWWGRTPALWQHPAHLVLRAIETRTGIARAANTGISMFIDPVGRSYGETRLFEPAVRVATVYTTDDETLFVLWGDWVGRLAVVFGVMVLVTARFRFRFRFR